MISYIISGTSVSFVIDNKPFTINQTHHNYLKIIDALKEDNATLLKSLLTEQVLQKYTEDQLIIDVNVGTVTYKDYQLPNVLINKLLDMYKGGFNVKPLLKFIDNLFLNPSLRAVNELYSFLEYGKLPITEDGCFLAYKKVNPDYTSIHDGKTMNTVGSVLEMPRNQVDDDSNRTCSTGFHLCSFDYLSNFGNDKSKVLIIKCNPKDVVSVPRDHNDTKARACRYEIYGEMRDRLEDTPVAKNALRDLPKRSISIQDILKDVPKMNSSQLQDLLVNINAIVASKQPKSDEAVYNAGYRAGCKKEEYDASKVASIWIGGYKDGRGHKKKRAF
jgi:hypothetical protein